MKISQLISTLQQHLSKHGDLDIVHLQSADHYQALPAFEVSLSVAHLIQNEWFDDVYHWAEEDTPGSGEMLVITTQGME